MRTIGVVTVGRSDYGLYRPVLSRIKEDPDLALHLIAAGMHLCPEFGYTARAIEEDGFEIADRVEMLLSSDTPAGVAKSIGLGTIGFAEAYSRFRPDILLVLGDRFEMLAAVAAALPFKLPVAHIHGGESTEGAMDEAIRHAITKMSHLHFVAAEVYAQRLRQMGEEAWRVMVSGAPGLDNLREFQPLGLRELEEQLGLNLNPAPLLVTYHPVTLEYEQTEAQMRELLAALAEADQNIVFTYPNADTHGRLIIRMIQEFAARDKGRSRVAVNLGTRAYFSLMQRAAAMVGNSSSGIIEAASFELPVVNVGARQEGRLRGQNVIDVGNSRGEIAAGIRKAVSPEFRAGLAGLRNPYGDGRAAERIVVRLSQVDLGQELIQKRFAPLGGEG